MQAKISKRLVDAISPTDRDAMVWDREVAGFGLRCRKAGGKYYVVKYRAGGRQRWHTIGRHGAPWTPEQARREAKRILGEIAGGGDPAAVREAVKASPTVRDFAERFLAEHAQTKTKPRTTAEYRRLLARHVLPSMGRCKVADVTWTDVAKLHHALRDTQYQANRVLALLSKIMNWAEKHGYRPGGSNPCRRVEKFKEKKREKFLSADELARLGDALTKAEAVDTTSLTAIAAIRLLIFTGARKGEILGLRWEWIDWQRCEARLPDSKTGEKTIHLPPPAMAVLTSLPRMESNPYVFVGHVAGKQMVNLQKPWRRIRAAAGLETVRLHDLRHAFASVAASSGLGLPIIGKMLGHTQAQATHRYAHIQADPVKAAAATVAGKIADAMKGGAGQRKVVELPRRR